MTSAPFDPKRKFVRLTERRPDGFVEFEFAVGEPEIFVEMILSTAAFDEFCKTNKVEWLRQQSHSQDKDDPWNWSLRSARHQGLD